MKSFFALLCGLFLLASCTMVPVATDYRYARLAPALTDSAGRSAVSEYYHLLAASTVHARLLLELGAANRLAGICDASYAVDSTLREAHLQDFGSSVEPDAERILAAGVDALMLSPIPGAGTGRFGTLGLPVISCADYMEHGPLARAEWMCYYGRLVGQGERVDSLFKEVEKHYLMLQSGVVNQGITALMDLPQGGIWYVPGGKSYLAQIFADAGYYLPCSESRQEAGSVALTIEQVIALGAEADVWFIKYASEQDWTYDRLLHDYPFVAQLRPFRERRIWGCNTLRIPFYEQVPFHPERLLRDLVEQGGRFYSPLH